MESEFIRIFEFINNKGILGFAALVFFVTYRFLKHCDLKMSLKFPKDDDENKKDS